jgi:5'-deoxynucleotidase YfbR-like HD superfamily hydrolase
MKHLNLNRLLTDYPTRLRYVQRYSCSRVVRAETVAEHSFFVALYCLVIADWVEDNTTRPTDSSPAQVDRSILLRNAILHDLDEAYTGDFQREFKYSDPSLKAVLDSHAAKAVHFILRRVSSDEVWVEESVAGWSGAKDDSVEGRILAFADFLSAVSYFYEEAKTANKRILEHTRTMWSYYTTFSQQGFEFLRPLVEQAGELLQEILV